LKLGISNIAWDPASDFEVAELLTQLNVEFIDVAPSKYFDLSKEPDFSEVRRVRDKWGDRGLSIRGMQALMYCSPQNLFGPRDEQDEMLGWLGRVCRIAENLEATYLVFGSPRNRDRGNLPNDEANATALDFFGRLGDLASRHQVIVCLEPNPRAYGANFLVSWTEVFDFVQELNHPGIRIQLDSGALAMDAESTTLPKYAAGGLIGHIHLSAPNLVPLHKAQQGLAQYLRFAMSLGPLYVPTIEILTSNPEEALSEIEQSILFVRALSAVKE